MNRSAALIVGLVIWIPTTFIVSIAGGHWFDGPEVFAAIGPLIAFGVPGLLIDSKDNRAALSMLEWTIALAPLLLLVGALSGFMLKRVIFGNTHTGLSSGLSPMLAFFLWCVLGWWLCFLFKAQGKSSPES